MGRPHRSLNGGHVLGAPGVSPHKGTPQLFYRLRMIITWQHVVYKNGRSETSQKIYDEKPESISYEFLTNIIQCSSLVWVYMYAMRARVVWKGCVCVKISLPCGFKIGYRMGSSYIIKTKFCFIRFFIKWFLLRICHTFKLLIDLC